MSENEEFEEEAPEEEAPEEEAPEEAPEDDGVENEEDPPQDAPPQDDPPQDDPPQDDPPQDDPPQDNPDQNRVAASELYEKRETGHVILKGRPCKIVEMTSKLGQGKIHFVGTDVFNGNKLEDIVGEKEIMVVPEIKRIEYYLMAVFFENRGIDLLEPKSGELKEAFPFPSDEKVLQSILDNENSPRRVVITIISYMGEEAAVAVKLVDHSFGQETILVSDL